MEEPRAGSDAWQRVDALTDPSSLVDYLDVAANAQRERRHERLRLLDLSAGDTILDIGCGVGDLMIDLAESIFPEVRATGIDVSAAMVAVAVERAAARGVDVQFRVGDAHALDFDDASLNGVHCTRVLMHVDSPELAVAEMARVVVPGGRIVITEPDWQGWILDSLDHRTATVVRERIAARIRQPDIGRRLLRLAAHAGLEVIDFHAVFVPFPHLRAMTEAVGLPTGLADAVADGGLDGAAAATWWESLQQLDADGLFFGAGAVFHLLARRPPIRDA